MSKSPVDRKASLVVSIILITIFAIAFGWSSPNLAKASVTLSSANLPTMSLTLIGRDGTIRLLHSTDIAGLLNITGVGGALNSVENVINYANWTGVPFKVLCDKAGGIEKGDVVNLTASDNYSITFTYDQVMNGSFVAYDPVTKNNITNPPPLTPIIAYYKNFANISDKGPLRVAIVGAQGYLTDSILWEYEIVKFQIVPGQVPEFPGPLILPLLVMLATLAIVPRARYHRKLLEKRSSREGGDTK